MKMGRIDVVSSCLVGMGSNATSMPRMELTPWDLRLLLRPPSQKGILFRKPPSQEIDKAFIDHLRDSLSRTLDFFPPLAGRLATIQNDDDTMSFFVDCSNAGVEFVHAVAAGAVSISDISEPTYIPEIVSSLFPLNGINPNRDGVSKPLFGVQVTELMDGLFIGCTASHYLVDGTSFWHFFNSWSEISRGFDTISKIPVFERWFPSNVAGDNHLIRLPPLEKNPSQDFATPPLGERIFHSSKESLAKLKARANSEAGTDKISSLQALSAHLWLSYTRCRHSHGIDDPSSFKIIVGARERIPLPDGYFGNAVHGATAETSETELLQGGLGYAALRINELVAQQTDEAVIKFVQDWVENPTLLGKGSFYLTITHSPRFNVYGNDFGWGKPIAARSGRMEKFDGRITLYPAAVGGGIDAEVCLALETLQAMGDDAEFMEAFAV